MWQFFALFVVLLLVLMWLTARRSEGFLDQDAAKKEEIPDPRIIFKQLRSMLDKFDNPEFLDHVMQVKDMDPGQLARLNLGIQQ